MCYSVINPCGYWTLGTLSVLVSNRNTLYNVMGVKRHIMPVDLPPSVSISGAELNLTFRAVSTGVVCCNLAESKSVLKMCFSKHCHEVTGFLLWIGTYNVSCVVQQRSRIKDLFSLVGYNNSCFAAIRHVGSIIPVIQPRSNIRSNSVLLLCSSNIGAKHFEHGGPDTCTFTAKPFATNTFSWSVPKQTQHYESRKSGLPDFI